MKRTFAVPYTLYCFGHRKAGTADAFAPTGDEGPFKYGSLPLGREFVRGVAISPHSEVRAVRIRIEREGSDANAPWLNLIEGSPMALDIGPKDVIYLDRYDRTDGLLVVEYVTERDELITLSRDIAPYVSVRVDGARTANANGANRDVHVQRPRGSVSGLGGPRVTAAVWQEGAVAGSMAIYGYAGLRALRVDANARVGIDQPPMDFIGNFISHSITSAALTAGAQTDITSQANKAVDFYMFRFASTVGVGNAHGMLEVIP